MAETLIVALGSNSNQEENITKANNMILDIFGQENVEFSETLWTEPIGLDSDKFLNQLAKIETAMDYAAISKLLKDIEQQLGAEKTLKRQGVVYIDIDILKLGNTIYHNDDWHRTYVKKLYTSLLSNRHYAK